MKIRVLGGGWYGAHVTDVLKENHEVELWEISRSLFSGASGSNPARVHLGFHYPRSGVTRAACQENHVAFMERYGHLTRGIPVNIYAVAADNSQVDFSTYCQVMQGVDFIRIDKPEEYGLRGVEGAVLTGERHVLIADARRYFEARLADVVRYGTHPGDDPGKFDWTIDCTFCANDAEAVDRYEPCMMVLLHGPANRAVTIMDGPFPSIYPWNEAEGLSSLTSAKWTPFSKDCRTYAEARSVLDKVRSDPVAQDRAVNMFDQMCEYWPDVRQRYKIVDVKFGIRAMPKSAADSRIVDVVKTGERVLRVRAGKIDAVFTAEKIIVERIGADS